MKRSAFFFAVAALFCLSALAAGQSLHIVNVTIYDGDGGKPFRG